MLIELITAASLSWCLPVSNNKNIEIGNSAGNNLSIVNYYDDDLEHLTSSDSLIDNYEPVYYESDFMSDRLLGVDSIVNIIPVSCFTEIGDHSYLGKEYGFFVRTIKSIKGGYSSAVALIDIDVLTPSFENDDDNFHVKVSINRYQLFKTDFKKDFTGEEWKNYGYDPDCDYSIYPVMGGGDCFSVSNVQVGVSLSNNCLPNYGDDDYSMSEDNGDFITGFGYDYHDSNVNGKTLFALNSIFELFMPLFPTFSKISTIFTQIVDINDIFGNCLGLTDGAFSDNSNKNFTFLKNSKSTQINTYSHLIKDVQMILKNDSNTNSGTNANLFTGNDMNLRNPEDYFDVLFSTSSGSGLEYSNLTDVMADISMKVNCTWGTGDGFPKEIKLFRSGYYTTYQNEAQKITSSNSVKITPYDRRQRILFEFVPTQKTYELFTEGKTSTVISLYDFSGNLLSSSSTGGSLNNALLHYSSFVSSRKYIVELSFKDDSAMNEQCELRALQKSDKPSTTPSGFTFIETI